MHCTVAFLDEYPLPDSFELKAHACTCLPPPQPSHIFWTLPESYSVRYPLNKIFMLTRVCLVGGVKITIRKYDTFCNVNPLPIF